MWAKSSLHLCPHCASSLVVHMLCPLSFACEIHEGFMDLVRKGHTLNGTQSDTNVDEPTNSHLKWHKLACTITKVFRLRSSGIQGALHLGHLSSFYTLRSKCRPLGGHGVVINYNEAGSAPRDLWPISYTARCLNTQLTHPNFTFSFIWHPLVKVYSSDADIPQPPILYTQTRNGITPPVVSTRVFRMCAGYFRIEIY